MRTPYISRWRDAWPWSGAEEEEEEGKAMRDMYRVQVTRTSYVALMPQGKLDLSHCVAFLTDAPEIEAIQNPPAALRRVGVRIVKKRCR